MFLREKFSIILRMWIWPRRKEYLGIQQLSVEIFLSAVWSLEKKEDIIEETKRLLDVCAPGGGYLFDFNGSLENCKPENLDAMFETLDKYGKY